MRNQVRLYDEHGEFERWITEEESDCLVRHGYEDHFEMRGTNPRKIGIRPPEWGGPILPEEVSTASSLSELDSQINAGITPGDPGMPPNAALVAAVRAKVDAWPYVYDTKAVRVGVRV